MDSNKEIFQKLKQNNHYKLKEGMLAGHICRPLSLPISVFFIRKNIKPNTITLFMIFSGIIGSIFFALPYIWSKIVGYCFWFLWFTFDLCDGQVARYTKNFSKYGSHMDFMAHLIDHPLMNIAIWLTFYQMNCFNQTLLTILFILCISIELIRRNLLTFYFYEPLKTLNINETYKVPETPLLKYLLIQISLYPTFVICFSLLLVIDYILNNGFSFVLLLIWIFIFLIFGLNDIVKVLMKFYKN